MISTAGFDALEELRHDWELHDHLEDAIEYGTSPDPNDRRRGRVHTDLFLQKLGGSGIGRAVASQLSEPAVSEVLQTMEINGRSPAEFEEAKSRM